MRISNTKSIEQFINHFHEIDAQNDITNTFTCGCCYWFAYILCGRFNNAKLMYDSIANHFVSKINNRLYDVTGDVTDKYNVIEWKSFDDEIEKQRIIDYCIKFTK